MAHEADNDPSTRSPSQAEQLRAMELCRDVYGGPLEIRQNGQKYLPRFPREPEEKYQARLEQSVLYDWFARTVRGLTGMVFREPPALASDIPKQLSDAWENIDLLGKHGRVFWAERHLDGEIDGHFVVFVDMSTKARRPYAIGIRKSQVVDAEFEEVSGIPMLVHFRYRLVVQRRKGRYGYEEVEKIREYNLRAQGDGSRFVEWVEHQRVKGRKGLEADRWESTEPAVMEIDEIPVVVAHHGDSAGPFHSVPPHLALAVENVKHYQLVSDNDNVLHICSVPQFAVIGQDDTARAKSGTVGPSTGWDLPQGAQIMYAEPQGNGLEAAERRIEKSEHRMALLGLSTLHTENRGPQTATSKRIEKAESDSQLSLHASATNDAMEEVLRLMAKWEDLTLPQRTEGRWVSLNMDFEGVPLEPEVIRAFADLIGRGLPWAPVLELLRDRGRLPKNTDLDALELQILAGAAARAEIARVEEAVGDEAA